jgi:hypothetical protein
MNPVKARAALVCVLLVSCGGGKPRPVQSRPEDVARAAFEALKAGDMGPLDPHLITPEEAKAMTGIVPPDGGAEERERWQRRLVQYRERLDIDWETAAPGPIRTTLDTMGRGAVVHVGIKSSRGTASLDVTLRKAGKRFVFSELKPNAPAKPKAEAAPEDEGC